MFTPKRWEPPKGLAPDPERLARSINEYLRSLESPGVIKITEAAGLDTSGNLTVDGNTVLGNAAGDTLTIAASAVTWSNNPTHSGQHNFVGLVAVCLTSSASMTIPADYGVIVPDHYTIASGHTITLESGAVMEIT